jgi:hypothetical protein
MVLTIYSNFNSSSNVQPTFSLKTSQSRPTNCKTSSFSLHLSIFFFVALASSHTTACTHQFIFITSTFINHFTLLTHTLKIAVHCRFRVSLALNIQRMEALRHTPVLKASINHRTYEFFIDVCVAGGRKVLINCDCQMCLDV